MAISRRDAMCSLSGAAFASLSLDGLIPEALPARLSWERRTAETVLSSPHSVLYTTCKMDGVDYRRENTKSVTIARRLIDAYTVEGVNKLDGKGTGGATQTVSQDAKTLTIKNKNGAIQVFEK